MIALTKSLSEQPALIHLSNDLQIRPANRDDLSDLQQYFRELSGPALYKRLFATSHAVPALFYSYFDQQEATDSLNTAPFKPIVIALLAISKTNDNTKSHIVGEAMMSIDTQTQVAEIGLSLAESHRRKKIGSALLQSLIDMGHKRSVVTVYADALRQNNPFIQLTEKHGFSKARHPEDWALIRLSKRLSTGFELTDKTEYL